jgi:hypothetical protein
MYKNVRLSTDMFNDAEQNQIIQNKSNSFDDDRDTMAARKSCTHMTWAEAKEKSGISSGKGRKDKKQPPLRQDHGKLLAAKIVAKNDGRNKNEKIKDQQAARQARKDQERQEYLDALRASEKEKKRLQDVFQPHELALQRMEELAREIKQQQEVTVMIEPNQHQWSEICESKQLQMDELVALQAIYDETDTLSILDSSRLEELQQKMETWQMDPDDRIKQHAVVEHPPLKFTLKHSFEDQQNDDFVLHLLLKVTLPSGYPLHTTPPTVETVWSLLTQKSIKVSSNKPLESTNLGILEEDRLKQAIMEQSQELVGMPCAYEVLDTFLSESIFDYITRL